MSTRHSTARFDRICSDKLLGRGLPVCKKQLADTASDPVYPVTPCATTASCVWAAASVPQHPSRIPPPPPVSCSSAAPSTTANPADPNSSSSSSSPPHKARCSRIPPPPSVCGSRRTSSTASDTLATQNAGTASPPTISLTIKTRQTLAANTAPHRLNSTGHASTVAQARTVSQSPNSSAGTPSLSNALARASLTGGSKQRMCQPRSAASSPRGPITPTATIRAWSPRRCHYSSADLELKLACPGSASDLWLSGGSGLELPEISAAMSSSQSTEADDLRQSSLESWNSSASVSALPAAAAQEVAQGPLGVPEAPAESCPTPAAAHEPAQAACPCRGELDYWLVDTAQCSWLSDGPLDEAFLVPGGGMAERWLNQVLAEADAREAVLRAAIAKSSS